jgi:hypothetical protein
MYRPIPTIGAVLLQHCLIARSLVMSALFLGLFTTPAVASDYFRSCNKTFHEGLESGNETIVGYHYTGRPRGLLPGHSPPLLITYEGCVALCGSSPKYYPWPTISDTITTWVLPIAGGLILQLPFESNRRLSTLLTLCRWLGSPMASLMYTL